MTQAEKDYDPAGMVKARPVVRLEAGPEVLAVSALRKYCTYTMLLPSQTIERRLLQIHETCPQCEHIGLRFHTMQLRSADEGQTVFFECVKCLYATFVR